MSPGLIGDRYRLGEAIGRGGMGTVWLARDQLLRRDVAVKQIGLLPGASATDASRALREARSAAALAHRNVVTVFDVIDQDDAIWLVMEHVPGRSLADVLRADGPLDPATVAEIGAQVAAGLAAAHASGVIHRDVKPGNVLVREDGQVKLSDFGIARIAGDGALTSSGLVTGTPTYFSPELARGEAPGPAADVWALGATLYTSVEGRSPYTSTGNPIAVLDEIASRQPPAPKRAAFLDVPLGRMLDRDPQSRWTMADAAHTLRRLADEHSRERTASLTRASTAASVDSTPPAPRPASPPPAESLASAPPQRPERPEPEPEPGPAPRRPPSRRRAWPAVLAAVLVLGAVGGLLWWQWPDGSGEPGRGASESAAASPDASASDGGSGAADGSEQPADSASTEQAAFVTDYFESDAGSQQGWESLGPNAQQVGRASYDQFWEGIESAETSNVRPGAEEGTVEATVRYRFKDGRVVQERQRLTLVRSGDSYLIDDDEVLSSRSVP